VCERRPSPGIYKCLKEKGVPLLSQRGREAGWCVRAKDREGPRLEYRSVCARERVERERVERERVEREREGERERGRERERE
jgi:hypothetical protein